MASDKPGQGWTNGDLPAGLYAQTIQGRTDLYQNHRRWIGLHSSWSRIGEGSTEISKRTGSSGAGESLVVSKEEQSNRVRALMAQLCEAFYKEGWATGTGGGISIRVPDPVTGEWRVFVAPSGLQKEDMIGQDMFELDMERNVVQLPQSNPKLRQSACTPLWYVVYKHRPKATAVLHTHSPNAVYATLLDRTETSKTLSITHLEMLKGVGNHAYDDTLELPIIDNRPTEDQLAEQFERAVLDYPKANAVLVRRHGLYVWGDSWEQCKTQAEAVDNVLATAIQMHNMGIDPGAPPKSGSYRVDGESKGVSKKRKLADGFNGAEALNNSEECLSSEVPLLPRDGFKALLLDIEGCTTSIAFVKDVLFPFAREQLPLYIARLGSNEKDELRQGLASEVKANGGEHSHDITEMVSFLMDRDIKSAVLKDMQGKIWKKGYEDKELHGHVYGDLRPTLDWMKSHGIPVYIYSSGSIQAQKLLFGNTKEGNLLDALSGHFDITTAGNKKESTSYTKITQSLYLKPASLVFVSDAHAELEAASKAGVTAVMSIRPGNVPLGVKIDDYPKIHSLLQLCGAE